MHWVRVVRGTMGKVTYDGILDAMMLYDDVDDDDSDDDGDDDGDDDDRDDEDDDDD